MVIGYSPLPNIPSNVRNFIRCITLFSKPDAAASHSFSSGSRYSKPSFNKAVNHLVNAYASYHDTPTTGELGLFHFLSFHNPGYSAFLVSSHFFPSSVQKSLFLYPPALTNSSNQLLVTGYFPISKFFKVTVPTLTEYFPSLTRINSFKSLGSPSQPKISPTSASILESCSSFSSNIERKRFRASVTTSFICSLIFG